METSGASPDVVAALLTAGYRVVGPVGRGAQGPAWSAVALDGPPTRVVVRVVDLAADPRHGARLDRLRGVRHDHLVGVRDVIAVRPGVCVMLVDHVRGPTLDALRSARSPLSAGEAVTLAVPLADALGALHAAGLVHADVSPANIVIGLDGRPVLVDLLGCLTGSVGTPGFVAPEVLRGEPCGPAGDVYSLARVVLTLLGPDDAGIDRGVLGEDSTDGRRVRDLLTAAADPDPRLRLAASELADACFRAHEAEPIALPDGAVLARTELARLAGRGGSRTLARPSSRHRGRAAPAGRFLRVVGAVVIGAVVVGGLLAFAIARSGVRAESAVGMPQEGSTGADSAPVRQPSPDATPVQPEAARPDPVTAASRLTQLRGAVISSGDVAALASVEVPASLASTADAAAMAGLAGRGLRVDGLTVDVMGADLVSGVDDRARVAVTSATSAYRLVRSDGAVDSTVPAGGQRTVVLVLQLVAEGWRVADVLEPDVRGVSAGTG